MAKEIQRKLTGGERFPVNGVNAMVGDYHHPQLTACEIAALARGEDPDFAHLQEACRYAARIRAGSRDLVDGRSELLIEEAGWGVIFAQDADPAVREALSELLELRKRQACLKENLFREFCGESGYRKGQTKTQFLIDRGSGPGEVDPQIIPYYLLLVGSPEEIPYHFQYQLDMRYAVGRIWFDSIEEYSNYARAIVASEKRLRSEAPRVALFGPLNPGDGCTEQSVRFLIDPLIERLEHRRESGWTVRAYRADEATKVQLQSLLGGAERPDILLTVTHGLCFPSDHPQQLRLQGALLCQEWPGPRWRGPAAPEWYLGADDIKDDARLEGLISFHFACYSGGTPRLDDFDRRPIMQRSVLTSQPFVAALPQRLLGHPGGGALAVVAHVDQAWSHSFMWGGKIWPSTFELALRRLAQGHPIGWAMETFNRRYAELASDLRDLLEQEEMGWIAQPEDLTLAALWTATRDTRGFVVLGDPAVRLPKASAEVLT